MQQLFNTIGLIGKHESDAACGALARLNAFLGQRGCRVLITADTAGICGGGAEGMVSEVVTLAEMGQRAEVVVVFGGDGTMLNAVRALAPFGVPLIGVNQGRVGFLADVSVDAMLPLLAAMLAGEHQVEDRILLDCRVEAGDGAPTVARCAFNDVVVSKGATGRLIEFEVYIDNQFVYSQRADGLVISTPTGSTAYALSAGGPILHPTLEAVVLAPICPHTLSARPIAVNSRFEIEVNLIHADDARVHFDGQDHMDLSIGSRVVINRAPKSVRLLHPRDHNYYETLRQKLHWGKKL